MNTVKDVPPKERLTIEAVSRPAHVASFAEEVRQRFAIEPRRLSPKWLYDEIGSILFDAICRLPEYDLMRVEGELLAQRAGEIVALLDGPIEFVELGSGSAVKTQLLIEAALARQPQLKYHPIDISHDALYSSAQQLIARYDRLEIAAYASDYFTLLERGTLPCNDRALVIFLGSNIGNYEPAEARHLIESISRALKPGDAVLLGADLQKEPREIELAYNDPIGVTAAFTKNILARMNRELAADFNLAEFEYHVTYDASRGALDAFLRARNDQNVKIAALDTEYRFAAGDTIQTESSYKFSLEGLAALGETAGLATVRQWTDDRRRFSETLYLKT